MKFFRMTFLFLSMSLLVVSCGDGNENGRTNGAEEAGADAGTSETDPTPPPAPEIPFDPEAVYLERMYATSTGGGSVASLLDDNLKTEWTAMPGAGMDEGVMLYFEPAERIERMKLQVPSGETDIKKVEIFQNGKRVKIAPVGEEIRFEEDMSSLYIRIAGVEGETERTQESEAGTTTILKSYSKDLVSSLSEIQLFGRDGKKLKVRPLHLENGTVEATSILGPPEAYNTDFLFDSRKEFGWAESGDGSGAGEGVTFNFEREVKITRLKIWNGYQRSKDHFAKNARAKGITFGTTEGEPSAYDLADDMAPEIIELAEPLSGKSFHLGISSVFEGSRYKDLVLSEIRFFDGNQWFGITGDGEARRISALQSKVKGTVLEDLLDRNFYYMEETDWDDWYSEVRLTLRSNGSFVVYKDFRGEIENNVKTTREVADGNWTIQKLETGHAQVKIFGKLHRFSDRNLLYKGKKNRVGSRIFSEVWEVYPDYIQGQSFLERFLLDFSE